MTHLPEIIQWNQCYPHNMTQCVSPLPHIKPSVWPFMYIEKAKFHYSVLHSWQFQARWGVIWVWVMAQASGLIHYTVIGHTVGQTRLQQSDPRCSFLKEIEGAFGICFICWNSWGVAGVFMNFWDNSVACWMVRPLQTVWQGKANWILHSLTLHNIVHSS